MVKKRKEKQGEVTEESSTTYPLPIEFVQESIMAKKQPPQPRRTLDDYGMQKGPRHFSSIVIPAITKALEIKYAFLSLISTYQFTTMDHWDPYTHLSTFYELVGTMDFQSSDIENVYLHLLPFSFTGKAKE